MADIIEILQNIGKYKSKTWCEDNFDTATGDTVHSEYEAIGIDSITINNITYGNYGAYTFIWEKSYVKSPERSMRGNIGNLNSYATFITPHLVIDFSIISIDDWRSIMRQHIERNEFVVQCYDTVYNKRITTKMYFATEELPKLYNVTRKRFSSKYDEWEDFIALVGVEGYKLEMIGTNNDLDTVSVVYHVNPPQGVDYSGTSTVGEEDVQKGTDVIIGASADSIKELTFGGKYRFANKWVDSTNFPYVDGSITTINADLDLYAQWESATSYTMQYAYGLSTPMIENGQQVFSKTVKYDEAIGTLPTIDSAPVVKYQDKPYYPYTNGAWYKTAVKGSNSKALTTQDLYWSEGDSTIYCLYDTKEYSLVYITNNANIDLKTQQVKYGDTMPLPELYDSEKVFNGWYIDSAFSQKVSKGTMPPYNLTLYAKWENKR